LGLADVRDRQILVIAGLCIFLLDSPRPDAAVG